MASGNGERSDLFGKHGLAESVQVIMLGERCDLSELLCLGSLFPAVYLLCEMSHEPGPWAVLPIVGIGFLVAILVMGGVQLLVRVLG